jgi:tripartite-type tricarboxylate transporter receptor subunit TctC
LLSLGVQKGVGRVARAAPDGYTLDLGQWGTHVLNGAIYGLPYDVLTDFEPVSLIADSPLLVVTRKSMPAKDLKELVAWLKANPDKASQGTSGVGGPSHVAGLLFQKETGTRFQLVSYRGAAPAMQDVAAGQVDMMFDSPSTSLPQVRGGTIKAYAVTARSRLATAPEIPSVDEAGLPGLHVSIWFALFAPKQTPKSIINRLNAAVVNALANPAVRQWLTDLGLKFRRAISRCRRRSLPCKKPKSRNGGPSSRRRTSRANEFALSDHFSEGTS